MTDHQIVSHEYVSRAYAEQRARYDYAHGVTECPWPEHYAAAMYWRRVYDELAAAEPKREAA